MNTNTKSGFVSSCSCLCVSEEESEEEEADVISREALKRQSQLIVDAKSKKKPWKKKTGKF